MIGNNDIVYVLSGGSENNNPDESLGGDPSNIPVLKGLNNLFSNVTPAEADEGSVDYRCFYVFNNSLTETLYNTKVYIDSEQAGGAVVDVGFIIADEIQKVTILGVATGGSLTLSYDGTNLSFVYNASLATWASNFQTALRTIPELAGVTVNAESSVSSEGVPSTIFTVVYTGTTAGSRFQPLLGLVSNDLTPPVQVTFSRTTGGSPINSIATLVDRGTTQPAGVVFTSPTLASPFSIGDLRPLDGFPVWLRRTTAAGTEAVADDKITLIVTGTGFPS